VIVLANVSASTPFAYFETTSDCSSGKRTRGELSLTNITFELCSVTLFRVFTATANSETKLGSDDGLNASEIVRAKLKSEGEIASRVGQGGTQSRQENVHTSLRAGEGVERT